MKRSLEWAVRRVAGSAVLLLLLAPAPGLAGDFYTWRTEDGTFAFADDVKKIPKRYRESARKMASKGLPDYARYTSKDDAATRRYEEQLAQRVDHLRRLNAAMEMEEGQGSAYSQTGSRTSLRLGGRSAPELALDSDAAAGPVVIEKHRYRPDGSSATRHNTVVRQGDRTLVVLKGQRQGESNVTVRDESELEN